MCRPNKWWWGVLPLALLWFLAGYVRNDAIEADLAAKASAQYPWAAVSLAGRDVTVSGIAPDEAARDGAVAAIDAIGGVRKVAAGEITVIAEQKPFTFDAKREGDAVTLSGFVPSEEVRKSINDAVKAAVPAAKVTDNLAIARGAPAAFAAAAAFGVSQLATLPTGAFSLSDVTAKLTGIAPSLDGFAAVQAAAAPTELQLTKEITPPTVTPYTFEAVREPAAVTLNGLVPSEDARKEITTAVAAAIPNVAVNDNLKLALGAPEGFVDAVKFGTGQLGKLTTGAVSLTGAAYSIIGSAPTKAIFDEVMAAKPPGAFTVAKSEVVAPAEPAPAAPAAPAAPEAPAAPAPAPEANVVVPLPEAPVVVVPVSPYVWSAEKAAGKITLDGFVPDEAARTKIVGAVTAFNPGVEVVDNQRIGAGAPVSFANMAIASLGQLSRLSSGKGSIADAAYTVTGVARTAGDFVVANQQAAAPPSGFTLAQASILPPVASPYRFSVEKSAAGAVALNGFYPSDAARVNINQAAAAAFPGAAITDNLIIAQGAPANFDGAVGFGIGQVSRLVSGKATISDRTFSIEGAAPNTAAYDAANAAAQRLPRGFTLGSANITAPLANPYMFGVEKAAGGVTLTGHYPSDSLRKNINEAAAAAFPGAAITDSMTIASGAPANFEAMAGFAMGQVAKLTTGKASISGQSYTISGAAPTVAQFETSNAAVRNPPRGFKLAEAAITGPAVEGAYIWGVTKAADGAVALSGLVPSDQARTFLAERAKAAFPGATITDNQEVKLGAPAGFAGQAVRGIEQVATLNFGEAKLADTAYSIAGEAPAQDVFDNTTKAANSAAAGFAVQSVNISVAIPTVRPYLVEARKAENGTIRLLGHAPSADAKAALAAKAAAIAAGAAVTDETTIALGLPETVDYEAATAQIFAELGKLKSGTARLADDQLSVFGNAPNLAAFDNVTGVLSGTLAGGMKKQTVSIGYPVEKPYVWGARRTPGVIRVKGFYERPADKEQVLAAVTGRFPGERVVDQMTQAAGAPACYKQAVDLSMLQLSRLITGSSDLVDGKLTLKGEAQTETAAAEIKAATEGLSGNGCTGEAVITVRAAEPAVTNDECQALFKDVLGKGAILFDKDKAEIRPESFGRIDNLAFVAKRCPDARIEISAHADSDASNAYNLALSERRAKSVVDYLVNQGIGPGRLTAVGYGEERPAVPNTSRENKAKNRRVEFNVQ